MKRNLVFAAVGAVALLAAPALMVGPAYAGSNSDSPPMPYTAPDPVYTAHKVDSTVDLTRPKDTVSLTDNHVAPGTAAPERR